MTVEHPTGVCAVALFFYGVALFHKGKTQCLRDGLPVNMEHIYLHTGLRQCLAEMLVVNAHQLVVSARKPGGHH